MSRPKSKLTIFFDTVSPYSWLGFEVAMRYEKLWQSVEFDYIPVFLGGMHGITGNVPPGSLPVKAVYGRVDLPRMKTLFEIPMMDGSPSKFPVNSLKAQRLLVAAREISLDKMKAATRGIWNQFWGQDRNLEEDSVLRDALTSAGFSEAEITKLFADINTPAIKDKLNANTKLCLDKKGFGAPWLWATKTDEKGQVVEDFYFGNDRWETVALFLEENWYGPVPGKKPIFKDRKIVGYLDPSMFSKL